MGNMDTLNEAKKLLETKLDVNDVPTEYNYDEALAWAKGYEYLRIQLLSLFVSTINSR